MILRTPFYEAIRQLILEEGKDNSIVIHTTLLPYIDAAGEMKTKPTQHSVQRLREIGLEPDMLICRTENNLSLKSKIKKEIGFILYCCNKSCIESRMLNPFMRFHWFFTNKNLIQP